MLNKNIKELRIENGLTQKELAEKIGVSQGAVYFWEKGINEPTAGYLVSMAELFGVSVDELLSYVVPGKGKMTEKEGEMNKLFSLLSRDQQDLMIRVAKEFLGK
jgi:transcriptional regulator with XRE-family HTH domain